MFAWSRTFYAEKDNVYYNFEMKNNEMMQFDIINLEKYRPQKLINIV